MSISSIMLVIAGMWWSLHLARLQGAVLGCFCLGYEKEQENREIQRLSIPWFHPMCTKALVLLQMASCELYRLQNSCSAWRQGLCMKLGNYLLLCLPTEIPHLCAEMWLVCVTVCSRKIYLLKFVLKRPAGELQISGMLWETWHTDQTKTKTQLCSEARWYFRSCTHLANMKETGTMRHLIQKV